MNHRVSSHVGLEKTTNAPTPAAHGMQSPCHFTCRLVRAVALASPGGTVLSMAQPPTGRSTSSSSPGSTNESGRSVFGAHVNEVQ